MKIKRVQNMFSNISNWHSYLLYKATGKKRADFLFKLQNNHIVKVPKGLIPEFKESFFAETYTSGLPKELLKQKGAVIIDIGANVGFFTLFVLSKFDTPKVISFEPIAKNFNRLRQNVGSLANPSLRLVNKAVSSTEGEIKIMLDRSADYTTSATIFSHTNEKDAVTISSTTLPKIIEDFALQKIDLLKLDCEGAEYGILYTTPPALFDKINCIALETHPGTREEESTTALASYLKTLGYQVKIKGTDLVWAYKDPKDWV